MEEKNIKASFVEIADGVIIPTGWLSLRKNCSFLKSAIFYISLISILISLTTSMIIIVPFSIGLFALLILTTTNPALEFDRNTGKIVIWSNNSRRKKLCEQSFNDVLFKVGTTEYEDSKPDYNMTIIVKNKRNYKFTMFNFEELHPNTINNFDIDKAIAERFAVRIVEFLRAYLSGEKLSFSEIKIIPKDSLK